MNEKNKKEIITFAKELKNAIADVFSDEIYLSEKLLMQVLHLLHLELVGLIEAINPELSDKLKVSYPAIEPIWALGGLQRVTTLFLKLKTYPEFEKLTPQTLVKLLFKIDKQVGALTNCGLGGFLENPIPTA